MITKIQVYKDEKININQSGLTTPMYIPESQKGLIWIDTRYKISSQPKLEYNINFREKGLPINEQHKNLDILRRIILAFTTKTITLGAFTPLNSLIRYLGLLGNRI